MTFQYIFFNNLSEFSFMSHAYSYTYLFTIINIKYMAKYDQEFKFQNFCHSGINEMKEKTCK